MMYKPTSFLIKISIFLIAVCTLVACSPSVEAAKADIKGGDGEFIVVIPSEPEDLNPNLRSDDMAYVVAQNTFNKLVTLDADYRVIPDLAKTWEISDDGLTYTFHLEKNVKWHDGQPLTSADVKWTFETIANKNGFKMDVAQRIDKIETPDDTTVIMHLKKVWSPFIPSIAWYGMFILPKHIYDGNDWTKNPANEKPVGSGPFMFSEWVKGEHIVLTANKGYFRKGPYLRLITYRFLKDSIIGADMLEKGEIDYLYSAPTSRQRIVDLMDKPGVRVATFSHPARYYIGFNLRRAPFDDLHVRQAVNMAINRTVLVDNAMLGYGAPGLGFYTPLIAWAYNPKAQVPAYNLDRARVLLDEAGLKPGEDNVRSKLTLVTFNTSPFLDLAEEIQEQLRAAGLEIKIILLNPTDFNVQIFQEQNFDMALTDGTWGPDPDNLEIRFGSSGSNQFMGYTSAEFDQAVAEGGRLVELDERAKAYFLAQEILAQDLPLAPLVENVQFILCRDNVSGLPQIEARGLVTFQDFSLVQVK